jgi:hypothetical protein
MCIFCKKTKNRPELYFEKRFMSSAIFYVHCLRTSKPDSLLRCRIRHNNKSIGQTFQVKGHVDKYFYVNLIIMATNKDKLRLLILGSIAFVPTLVHLARVRREELADE